VAGDTASAVPPEESLEREEDELARRATDPTASPPNLAFINDVALVHWPRQDGTSVGEVGYQIRFQPVIPFKAWGVANILRITIPYQVAGPVPSGLEPIAIFDLVILPQSWGRIGVGAVGSFGASASDAPHAAGGPALGFVAGVTTKLNLGVFNQNLFGNGVALSQLQPIAAYQLGSGWSLSLGDLQWVIDWNRGELVSMPLGVQLGKVLPIAGQPMRFAVNPQYDLKDVASGSRFSVLLTVQLLLPEGKPGPAKP
jgi:hypothetical protein